MLSRAYGLASLELRAPLTVDSVFELASMSKQFTAMDVILLALDGRLSLEDDVRKYVPELPSYPEKITIANLLHQTSGLKDYNQLLTFSGAHSADILTSDRALALIARQDELNFAPGTAFWYSDTNYFLLALIVERISNESIQAFSQAHIFGPLGMTHTGFRVNASAVIVNAASGYRKREDGWYLGSDNSEVLGDSGVFSTLADLAKWDQNFYNKKVGGEAGIRLMLATSKLADGTQNNYSAGLKKRSYHGFIAVEHAGDAPGFETLMRRFPEEHLGITVLCNSRDFLSVANITDRLSDLYLPAGRQSNAAAATKHFDVSAYRSKTGIYWDGKTDLLREISIQDGQLMQHLLPDDSPTPLRYVSPNVFTSSGGTIYTFGTGTKTLSRNAPGESASVLSRVSDADLVSQDVTPFRGKFFSNDVQVDWNFTEKHGHLILHRIGFPDEDLQFMFRDAYLGDLGLFHFKRSKEGLVTGLEVMNFRLGRVTFLKQR